MKLSDRFKLELEELKDLFPFWKDKTFLNGDEQTKVENQNESEQED